MSLPREWSLQDSSTGTVNRPSATVSTFVAQDPFVATCKGAVRAPTSIPITDIGWGGGIGRDRNRFNGGSRDNYDDDDDVDDDDKQYEQSKKIYTETEAKYRRKQDHEIIKKKSSLLAECNPSGSLFSIHSAPPVALGDLASIKTGQEFGFRNGTESPRRPASLAIEPNCIPAKTPPGPQSQALTSELEEEDNENLLTVSSLTARPLIAKSREIRSNKLAKQRKHKLRAAEPPDGGYGWLVVFGAFSVLFWVAGLVKSYGVLYVEIMETFPSTSAAVASWIPAILSALCLVLAPVSSALCQRFSCRTVVFIGGIFCALGLTLSYFATSLIHLLFTFGILTGIGGGLSTTPGIIIVSQYFDKHRALANGICISGTAAGSFVFPMLIEHLVHNFGFHGTILILGGCMLHVCVSATLYRPLVQEEEEAENGEADIINQLSINPCHYSSISNINILHQRSNSNTEHTIGINNFAQQIHGNDISTNVNGVTNSTYLSSSEEPLNNKKFIEHLFMEESKNRINDFYNSNKFVNVTEKTLQFDSDDEDKDIMGETTFMKPIKSVRSSSILHSVEDLSTDSTCVYKNRSGFDSNRGSRRRNKNGFTTEEILSQANNNEVPLPIPSNRGLSKSMIIPTPVSDFNEFNDRTIVVERKKKFCCNTACVKRYIDVSLLKNPTFILMCLSVTLMSTGCPYMLYYLPAYVLSTGYTKSEAGYLIAVSSALDLIGRLGFGWLSDMQLFDRKKAYITSILGAGLAVLAIPLARSWYAIGPAAGIYGLCLGCWYLLMPVLLADLFGTDKISSSYGLVRMFQSVGAISVPPLAGYLRDLSGGYEICFYCMGTCMLLGSVPLLVLTFLHDNWSSPEESEISTVS